MVKIEDIKISEYNVTFKYDNEMYKLSLFEIIDYLDSYWGEYVTNSDGVCDLIEPLAAEYNLVEIWRIMDEFDESIIMKYEYFIIDLTIYELSCFNNLKELNNIYEIKDIISNIIENNDLTWYCEQLN